MSESSEEVRLVRLRRKRVVLRAFNGAGLGVLLGGLVGAAIGGLVLGVLFNKGGGTEPLMLGILYGLFPGMFGGFWIGMTAVMRDGRRGVVSGTSMGAVVGLAYAFALGHTQGSQEWIGAFAVFTTPCGLVGGLVLSLLIQAIRARWGWWTRWEE